MSLRYISIFLFCTLVSLNGQQASPKPVVADYFPDNLHSLIFRNWYLVPTGRIAKVVKTSETNINQIASSMGLPEQPEISEEQLNRSYITIIKHNWHLLPKEQLIELLGWTSEKFDFILKEDDFLFVKLGNLKPACEPVYYSSPDSGIIRSEKKIAAILNEEFSGGINPAGEALFNFIRDFDNAGSYQNIPKRSHDKKIRFCYSYFALYGDPLADTLLNPYPDGYLQQLAESGINGIWLPALLSKLAPFPWDSSVSENYEVRLKNLRTLVLRAKRYGIGVYLYLNEPRSMPLDFFKKYPDLKGVEEGNFAALCTSNPEVREYLTDAVASICDLVPDLAGFFTITASENLTSCWSHGKGAQCQRCAGKDPADVIAGVNIAIFNGLKKSAKRNNTNPGPRLIAWDWGWDTLWTRKNISQLPHDISLMCVSEWGIPINRGGVESSIGEYCLSVVGPGEKARNEWGLARENNMEVFAKIQANITWEISAVPYLPVVENVAMQAKNLNNENVTGIMAGWTLGGYPSPNLDVLREISENPELSPDEGMINVARKRYGEKVAPYMVKAWKKFSRAFGNFPFNQSVVYQAPLQVGPANQLCTRPTGYKSSMVGFPYDDIDGWRGPYPVQAFINQLDSVASGFDVAISDLLNETNQYHLKGSALKYFNDDVSFATVASIHYRSIANQMRFISLRDELIKGNKPEKAHELLDEIEKIVLDEKDLAKRLYKIQSGDSRIGFEASNHYFYIPGDLIEKVINCRYILDSWLPGMRGRYLTKDSL